MTSTSKVDVYSSYLWKWRSWKNLKMMLFLTAASKLANVCQLSALIFCNIAYFVTLQFQVIKRLSVRWQNGFVRFLRDKNGLSDYFATVYFFIPHILCLFSKNHSRLEICSRYVYFGLYILSYHKKHFSFNVDWKSPWQGGASTSLRASTLSLARQ